MIRFQTSRWGKVWFDLPEDKRLERDHYRVYIRMAGSVKFGTNLSIIGQRKIAKGLEISAMTVGRLQADMAEWGHLRPVPQASGMRGCYEMLAPVFNAVPKARPADRPAAKPRGSGVRNQAHAWAKLQEERLRESA